jgi:DNA-binding LacI/PurR family transcriptional regulator
MVREAVGYLLAHGRRRIALLAWSDEPALRAFEGLLREAGLEPEPRWMKPDLSMNDPDALHEALRQIWHAVPEPPDGLVCLNDFVFERTIPTILELGIRVPEQLMIDTHRWIPEQLPPPLSSG